LGVISDYLKEGDPLGGPKEEVILKEGPLIEEGLRREEGV